MSQDEHQLKLAAAESAAKQVMDGMIVGLGSGTTATLAVDSLGKRVREGLRIVGVPTSERTADQARALGIPLSSLNAGTRIDMTIDGADEVEEGNLNLIKGHGGALLREKIIANASQRVVIVVHEGKLVKRLAVSIAVPIEVVPFGWPATAGLLHKLGATPCLRKSPNGEPFRSDGGNYILDCGFPPDVDAETLAGQLDHVVGLVEHGIFIGMTSEVHLATASGVRILRGQRS